MKKFHELLMFYNPKANFQQATIQIKNQTKITSTLDQDIVDFFEQLLIASHIPNSQQLNNLIIQSLQKVHSLYSVDFILSQFHHKMLNWLKHRQGHTITAPIARKFFDQLFMNINPCTSHH